MTSLAATGRRAHPLDAIQIAVVIPCYKQAHYLGDALESVLEQTHGNVDVVVVDDGSPDDTAEVAARFPGVRCLRQENQGLSAARNAGLAHCDAEFVQFLDADDRLLPNALRRNLECLVASPQAGLAYGAYRHIDQDGNPLDLPRHRAPDGDPFGALLRRNIVEMHGAVLYRRAPLEAAGGFDTSLKAAEDYDVYLRIAKDAPLVAHGELVAEYRKYVGSMSFDARRMLAATLRVLRRHRQAARSDPDRRAAYDEGLHDWKSYYGELLLGQLGNRIRAKNRIDRIARDAATALLHVPGALASKVVRKVATRTTGRRRGTARPATARKATACNAILMFHRVAAPQSDAWGLAVRPENFAQQLRVLAESFEAVPLHELGRVRGERAGSVALTFDDGYADNLLRAAPLLEEYAIPATVFVAGGPGDEAEGFWWDALERLALRPNTLPKRLEFELAGIPYRFDLGADAEFTPDAAHHVRDWRAEMPRRPSARHTLFLVLHKHLATLPEDQKRTEIESLVSQLGLEFDTPPEDRRMTRQEIITLSQHPLIEIGGHTVHHPRLSLLDAAQQRAEIEGNRDHLKTLTGAAVRTFAYPHGDYSDATPQILQELGFEHACTTRNSALTDADVPLELPRLVVEDWDGAEFERRLRASLGM